MNKNGTEQIPQTNWKKFLWNSDTKEFLGRSGKSWVLITIFYIIFFAFLGCFFFVTIRVLLTTLKSPLPRYQDRVGSPGFVVLPKAESFHIAFVSDDATSYESHVNELRTFLQGNKYSNNTENETCVTGVYRDQQPLDQKPMATGESKPVPRACPFPADLLGPCSGIHDPTFGYGSSNPCILIKMNKGEEDSALIHNIEYYPKIFDPMYFPFYGKVLDEGYIRPSVAVHLWNVTQGRKVAIKCHVTGEGINTKERDRFLGRVSFSLQINAQNPNSAS
uniref:Sodium/potassium-transporting ATPase subunit beta n=1 Tax=Eptatretus burgeri TaxID=7764 RepID=A0A8C4WY75_EPTBU